MIWSVEMSGTFTRDIVWVEVRASSSAEAELAAKREKPSYRVRSVVLADRTADANANAERLAEISGKSSGGDPT